MAARTLNAHHLSVPPPVTVRKILIDIDNDDSEGPDMSPSRSQSPDCDHVLHRLPEVAAGGSVWSGYRPDGIDEAARQQRQEVEAGRGPLRILAPGRVEHLLQRRAVWVAVTGSCMACWEAEVLRLAALSATWGGHAEGDSAVVFGVVAVSAPEGLAEAVATGVEEVQVVDGVGLLRVQGCGAMVVSAGEPGEEAV